MIPRFRQYGGLVQALALILFLGLLVAGILSGEYRLIRIESATL